MIKKELQQDLNRTKLVLDYARQEIKEKDKEIERLNKQYELMEEALEDKAEEIERLNNIIKEAIEYHNNCIEKLDLDKIDDNEKLAYKVAYGIHNNYLKILKGE